MLSFLSLVLNTIADTFISKLVESATDTMKKKLQKDSTKIAFMKALGTAIENYAYSKKMRAYLASPLLEKDTFLKLPSVMEELTQLVRFGPKPDAKLIGQKWKNAFEDPPAWIDFTTEANDLIRLLEIALRNTDVFRPVFDSQSLTALATTTSISSQSLTHIEAQLAQLETLLTTRFSELIRAFSKASFNIHDDIRDYTYYINEKTHDFVGRQFLIDAFTRFTEKYPGGYVFLRGDPGIGKSAFAAYLVKTNGYVHHFNIRGEGVSTADRFLKNICAQLIAKYQLNYPLLPPEATQDTSFLNMLLEEISKKIGNHEKAVIIVDALDEVDRTGLASGANILYLPMNLPPKIYFLVTMRRVPLEARIVCDHQSIDIEHNSAGNVADVHEYLTQVVGRLGIQTYITMQGIDNELFIEHLIEKSEGNFMYLRYVLYEIEQGAYKDLDLKALPVGLQNYYEDHWRRISNKDQNSWFEYELPVITTLTAAYKPISIEFIAYTTTISTSRIRTILAEWEQFLHSEVVLNEGVQQERYQIYHMSFHDFLAQKKSVKGELSVLQEAHRNIARTLLRKEPKNGKLPRSIE